MKYDIKPCTEEDADFIEEKLDAINHSIVPQEEGAEDAGKLELGKFAGKYKLPKDIDESNDEVLALMEGRL